MDVRPVKNGVHLVRRALAQVTLFLPLLLLSALALGSFLLYQITPGFDKRPTPPKVGNDADYYVERFAARQYDAKGQLKSEIFGDKAVHYPSSRLLEIKQARFNSSTETGQMLTASSTLAWANDDRSEVQLLGNAQLRMTARTNAAIQDPVEFFSDHLRVLVPGKMLISDVPIKVTQGQNTFKSSSMRYDHSTQILSLKGNVHMTLFPRKP
jgi:lipopolysaccharide export system protein LptC